MNALKCTEKSKAWKIILYILDISLRTIRIQELVNYLTRFNTVEMVKFGSYLQGRPYVRKRSILLIASQLIEGAEIF